jgi:methyl-accepting chemotaxis protein
MSATVSTAMTEQAVAVGQITAAANDMRRQSEQTSRGLAEQSRAASDISSATQNVSRQISLLVRANREQSENAVHSRASLEELRRISERATKSIRDAGLASLVGAQERPSPSGPVSRA